MRKLAIAALLAGFRLAFFAIRQKLPAEAEMPFADHTGVVALLP